MPLTKNILTKYPNPVFIETGTHKGDCSLLAEKLGFIVYTVEFDLKSYNICKQKFKDNDRIHIYYGDSAAVLPNILKEISLPATIWLDAHPIIDILTVDNCPILQELKAIKYEMSRLKFKILIDDINLFDECSKKEIIIASSKLGIISYEPNKYGQEEILVIQPQECI
jgi:hypothetical protein